MRPGLATVILAGGRGERMGGAIKANVTVGGTRLLERVRSALGPADVELVSTGRFTPEQLPLLPGQVATPDLDLEYGGPLAGLLGAINWCQQQRRPPSFLLTVAVDTPFLPADFVARMLAALPADSAGIVSRYAGQAYPTNALWRFDAVAGLVTQAAMGKAPRSLKAVATACGAGFLDWPSSATGDPFENANTADELRALEARYARANPLR